MTSIAQQAHMKRRHEAIVGLVRDGYIKAFVDVLPSDWATQAIACHGEMWSDTDAERLARLYETGVLSAEEAVWSILESCQYGGEICRDCGACRPE